MTRPEPDDAAVVDGLHAATPLAVSRFRDALAAYRADEPAPVPWTPQRGSGTGEDPYQLPYPQYPEAVTRLTDALVDVGARPVFGWMDWPGAASAITVDRVLVAPLAEVLRLITVLVRRERFSEGELADAVDSGVLLAMADRVLEELDGR